MALFHATVKYVDEAGKPASHDLHGNWSDATNAANALKLAVEELDIMSLCKIESVTLNQEVDISGWTLKSAAASGADRRYGGRFVWNTDAGVPTYFTVPGLDPSIEPSVDAPIPDPGAGAGLGDMIDALEGQLFSDYRGSDISSYKTGYVVHGGKQ